MRNNIRTCITIPQYANVTVYGDIYHLTVTFNVKPSIISYIKPKSNIWDVELFHKNKRNYITAKLDIPIKKIVESGICVTDCIFYYSSRMCNDLKTILREAKIKELQEEVKQLSLF